jgi:integrase
MISVGFRILDAGEERITGAQARGHDLDDPELPTREVSIDRDGRHLTVWIGPVERGRSGARTLGAPGRGLMVFVRSQKLRTGTFFYVVTGRHDRPLPVREGVGGAKEYAHELAAEIRKVRRDASTGKSSPRARSGRSRISAKRTCRTPGTEGSRRRGRSSRASSRGASRTGRTSSRSSAPARTSTRSPRRGSARSSPRPADGRARPDQPGPLRRPPAGAAARPGDGGLRVPGRPVRPDPEARRAPRPPGADRALVQRCRPLRPDRPGDATGLRGVGRALPPHREPTRAGGARGRPVPTVPAAQERDRPGVPPRGAAGGRGAAAGAFSRDLWERAAKAFGRPELHPHDLRHTALTLEGRRPGASLESIRKLGGWMSAAMADRYLHPDAHAIGAVRLSSNASSNGRGGRKRRSA